MKDKLLVCVLTGVITFIGINTHAENLTSLNEPSVQTIEIEKSGAVAILQKQPTMDTQKQVIRIKKAGGFLLIQINGKVKDTDCRLQNSK